MSIIQSRDTSTQRKNIQIVNRVQGVAGCFKIQIKHTHMQTPKAIREETDTALDISCVYSMQDLRV
jgi:hypothetical protein